MGKALPISRRDFLKTAGLYLGAFLAAYPSSALSAASHGVSSQAWPSLRLEDLPPAIAAILSKTPDAHIDRNGVLGIRDPVEGMLDPVPQVRTRYNLENAHSYDRLNRLAPWGIVLHWFGDKPGRYQNVSNYLNGFNSLRKSEDFDEEHATSAHFLIGDHNPYTATIADLPGILQTQMADKDGTPFAAAHVRGLSFEKYENNQQYFVKAFNQLSYQDPAVHSLLQDMYAGRWISPNARTIAIEIAGQDFDHNFPSVQKIANVLAVVRALMIRYHIPANHILGHHEVQMNKGDPGKQFMALMRFLVGVAALVDSGAYFRRLVFGQYLTAPDSGAMAVARYFKFGRDYHSLISKPIQVFSWDIRSQYWNVLRLLPDTPDQIIQARNFFPPIAGEMTVNGFDFLDPENHEGVDLHQPLEKRNATAGGSTEIQLLTSGQCLFAGKAAGCHHGQQAIFRHLQPDGGEVISLYAHLHRLGEVTPGSFYPERYPLGQVANAGNDCGAYLHFAIAYGATWELELSQTKRIPDGAGPTYIRDRFFNPLQYLSNVTRSNHLGFSGRLRTNDF